MKNWKFRFYKRGFGNWFNASKSVECIDPEGSNWKVYVYFVLFKHIYITWTILPVGWMSEKTSSKWIEWEYSYGFWKSLDEILKVKMNKRIFSFINYKRTA